MTHRHADESTRHHRDRHRHDRERFDAGFSFSANEIAFAGYAGADNAALITAVIERLAEDHRIAYLERDAQDFPLGNDGRDSWRAASSGASPVFIADGERHVLVGSGEMDEWNARYLWNDADIVLVEDHRRSAMAKILIVDRTGEVLRELSRGELTGVIAFVRCDDATAEADEALRAAAGDLPVFDLSQTGQIAGFVLAYLTERASSTPLYGLVLGGGKSTRMRRDKAAIEYRGVPQVRFAYSLLEGFCERVFVSNRAEQAAEPVFEGLEQIHDRFVDFGPMGGILSAMHAHPQAAWLVLGCDLPFVDEATLRELVAQRDPLLQATCYVSAHDGLPEPLCALYEPRYRRRLHQFLADGRECPRKALINTRVKRILLSDPTALDNINDPEEYELAAAKIREEAARGR